MVTIIDYGMGNIGSVVKAFTFLGQEVNFTDNRAEIEKAERIVLPGVGAIRDALENLRRRELDKVITEAIDSGKPFLGICLGLQMLFTTSCEGGRYEGLNIIPGEVRRFEISLKVPHIGWNQIHFRKPDPFLSGIESGAYVYFVHSFYVVPEDESVALTKTDYEIDFVSGVRYKNAVAVQFHPEKSQSVGLNILRNFIELKSLS